VSTKGNAEVVIAGDTYQIVYDWNSMQILEEKEGRSFGQIFGIDDNDGEMHFDPSVKFVVNALIAGLAKNHPGMSKRSQVIKMLEADERSFTDVFSVVVQAVMNAMMGFFGYNIDPDVQEKFAEDTKTGEEKAPAVEAPTPARSSVSDLSI